MKRFWHFLSVCLLGLTLSCAGEIPYWTYTSNQAATHVIHPANIPVWVDGSFTTGQIEEIRAAIIEWNYVFNGQMTLYLVEKKALGSDKKMHNYPDSFATWEAGNSLQEQCEKTGLGWVVFNLPSGNKHLDEDVGENTLAYVRGIDEHAVIVISDRFGNRSIKDVVMHEFGHLLGALHVNTLSLEYPYYSGKQYSCIDKITVAQVAQTRGLDLDKLNYCITPHFE